MTRPRPSPGTRRWSPRYTGPAHAEPPRNVSNLRNNRISVEEPRLVKTPGTIKTDGIHPYPEDIWDASVYQLAFGLDFNQNPLPDDVVYPKIPLDIDYSRTKDKGQRYESVIVTPQGGSGKPQEGWNPLAKDKPQQGAAQLRQTPDGSRMYGIWLEEVKNDNGMSPAATSCSAGSTTDSNRRSRNLDAMRRRWT